MAGKFMRCRFSDCSLEDPFFDSLKKDYPGFTEWYRKKAALGAEAFVFTDADGVCAFLYLKEDDDEQIDLEQGFLPRQKRLKIGTLKLTDRFQGQRLGEGAFGIALWRWQELPVDEVYLTVFSHHADIIFLAEKFGFKCAGTLKSAEGQSSGDELLYVKRKSEIDYSDVYRAFPYIKPGFEHARMMPIWDFFHDRILPYSELRNTEQEFWDEAAGNGMTKIFIGAPSSKLRWQVGDPVFIYRLFTGSGVKKYRSCITSFATIAKIEYIKERGQVLKDLDEFIKLCGNKTIFSEEELRRAYTKSRNLVMIEFVYNGFFGKGKNVIFKTLKDWGLFDTHPYDIEYTFQEFAWILKAGGKDVQNIVVDTSAVR